MSTATGTLAVAFAALFAAHQVADHWIQTGHQAAAKGRRDWSGRLACARHISTLTATKLAALAAAFTVCALPVRPAWWIAALGVDAASHYWADRRFTLRALAERTGSGQFFDLGVPRDGRDDNPSLGTGAYALDQSFHVGWLFIAALILAAGAR
jgi:hypothetical protein